MSFIYLMGSKLVDTLSQLYTFFFDTTLSTLFDFNYPLWIDLAIPGNPFKVIVDAANAILLMLGLPTDITVGEMVIGFGLIGLLTYRMVKFFVGIVTGS